MKPESLIVFLPLIVCIVSTGLAVLVPKFSTMLRISIVNAFIVFASSLVLAFLVAVHGRLSCFGNQLFLDHLSALHLVLVTLIFLVGSVYGLWYYSSSEQNDLKSARASRRYGGLWNGFLLLLILVLYANNLGFLWVMVEATTLVSALLILTHQSAASIEAMWKYLLICSVGIAFAFAGTLLVSIAQSASPAASQSHLLWTSLADNAGFLDPNIMLVAFIFVLVGYGTKAGIAPMHTWLPDAHSQTPTPVSAVFSGVMLNCALYAIIRFLPLCEASSGFVGKGRKLMLALGLVSMVIGAIFIPTQKNLKRFFAYCSIEHIGIMCIGIGSGGIGAVAAMLHTIGHALSKSAGFCATGILAKAFGTLDASEISGALKRSPVGGFLFFASILLLCGAAPGLLFFSEFLTCYSLFENEHYSALGLFLITALIIFFGMLWRGIEVTFGSPSPKSIAVALPWFVIVTLCSLVVFAGFGIFVSKPFYHFVVDAGKIIEHGMIITSMRFQ